MEKTQIEEYWKHLSNWEAYKNSYFPEDQNALPHLRSKWLVDLFRELEIESVLEIGTSCGRNLYHMKKAFPDVSVAGIDICADAIGYAETRVDGEFTVGSVYDLNDLITKEYDLVFSFASLCYVSPEHIENTLNAISKIAIKHIYHFEDFGNGEEILGETQSRNHWALDLEGYYRKKGSHFVVKPIPEMYMDATLKQFIKCDLGTE